MINKLKVVKKLKLNEIYLIDDGFFYIEKKEIKGYNKGKFIRYFLKTIASPSKMELINKFIQGTIPKETNK